ncbi:Plant protein 1589 [Perilla frutescens var. frutescens]|nr:Plant protein 1589 [Perilla frutescens var. frutescens]KAH6807318.1 Plant protein 1589 [Perilla frutescens var. frutescens]
MGSDSPSGQYIHMVQHLIEECIVFKMSKEECMEALERHANIKPVITSTEKENKEFFEEYAKKREDKGGEGESSQRKRIQEIVSDSTRKNSSHDDK